MLRSVVMTLCVGLSALACDIDPCEALDLRASGPPDPERGAVVAIGQAGKVQIIRGCDDPASCVDEALELDLGSKPDQLMLTASGRWLAYRLGPNVSRIDLDSCASGPCSPSMTSITGADMLIGTLRGGDWLIYRANHKLRAAYVGDEPLAGAHDFALGTGSDWQVVAMGHRHLVARESYGDGSEDLHLIAVAPARKLDELVKPGDARLLASGPIFGRVLFTEGPSPAERGDPQEFQHGVPTDTLVIASSGQGPEARTLIYAVADRSLQANFPGEVVTKHAVREDIPGLSAVSPDGTQLAFIRRDGGLALRNLETHGTCLVRGSDRSRHLLAGFAADATLYFEAEHRHNPRFETVHAYDPREGVFSDLIDSGHRDPIWRLKAVPQHHDGEPWAIIGLADGDHIVREGQSTPLEHGDVDFLPRSSGDIWMLDSDGERLDVLPVKMGQQTAQPLFSHPLVQDLRVCKATSQSTSRTTPWATRCSDPDQPDEWLSSGLPESEQDP